MGVNKRYYWLKLQKDFFQDKLIKKIRSLAGGDTYCVAYLKMMLLSLDNEGKLYYEGVESTFGDEIALTIDEKPEVVKVLVDILVRAKRLAPGEMENEYVLQDVKANTGSETAGALRTRRFRERQVVRETKSEEEITCNVEVKAIARKEQADKPIKEAYSRDFEQFWEIYPRKIDKGGAYKKYVTRIKGGWTPEQLLEAATAYAFETRRERTEQKFIKHPKTFLSDTEPFRDYIKKKQKGSEEDGGAENRNPFGEFAV